MLKPYLYLDKTANAGRGVFTRERIPKGTVIEISPVVVMSNEDRIHLDKTKLHDYIFEWGKEKDRCCMALGFIPMCITTIIKAIVNILWILMMRLFL